MSHTARILETLRQFESRNVTFMEADGSWPIVWERARGTHVWDAEGRRYLDLTAAFGVAATGHTNARVVRAGQRQMGRLLHAMGDVHPHPLKAQLARGLSRFTYERWTAEAAIPQTGKTIFCNSGFEAVEAALKTALLATKHAGVIAFRGAYHGLGYGTLNVTERAHFRGPFLPQLGQFSKFVDFPATKDDLKTVEKAIVRLLNAGNFGTILVEPVQMRGGVNIPPAGFLKMLRSLCDERGICLVLDEIYTGFGRTGRWFACEHEGVLPDVICLGKALTGGFPLSACVGRAELMDRAWPASTGEAIHTSTFLGHPVGCAMAFAQMREIAARDLVAHSGEMGGYLLKGLHALRPSKNLEMSARGIGLAAGLELRRGDGAPATEESLGIIKQMLVKGFILLPEGARANVISFTPPLTITRAQIKSTLKALQECLTAAGGGGG